MRNRWLFVAPLLAVGCLPTREGDQPDLSGQDVHLTILHTSDIHSRLVPYDLSPIKTDIDLGIAPEAPPYGGATRLAALIKRERANSDRVIHLDSGDQFEGAPIFNVSSGEPEIRFMSLVQPDAVVIGNHEFDRGARLFAEQYQKWGTYPLLASNYLFSNPNDPISNQLGKMSRPYVVLNQKGLRIGVIGLANLGSLNSIVEGGNSLQITPLEQNEVVRGYVDLLRPQVDLIVIVSHAGLTEDQQLVTGYEAYYPARSNIDEFLNENRADHWIQLEPTYPDGTRHVFIPGVRDIDVIMGGHLHIVLNPTQEIVNPNQPNRKVLLQHSGAFSKYLGRLDLVVHMPSADEKADGARAVLRGEVSAHDYRVFPIDALWCDDEAHSWRKLMASDDFRSRINAPDDSGKSRIDKCVDQEDRLTTWMLEPYVIDQTLKLELPRIFAFAPKNIDRRNSSSGGDSPLGNLTAESMRIRRRVEAEFALTNTLGIRDNLYSGPITLEDMFNVFPFENTINIMYLSGREMHELFDYTASRSADRGCQSQGQIAGARFTMDCAQAIDNLAGHPCKKPEDCQANFPRADDDTRSPWQCQFPNGGDTGVCYAQPSYGIEVNGQQLNPDAQYKVAVNDYIARGGSGFKVLQRNTTRIETNVSLRDGLIEYFRGQCTCEDILSGKKTSSVGLSCETDRDASGNRQVDPVVSGYCHTAQSFESWLSSSFSRNPPDPALSIKSGACTCEQVKEATNADGTAAKAGDPCFNPVMLNVCTGACTCTKVLSAEPGGPCDNADVKTLCQAPPLSAGKCSCLDVLLHNTFACGHVTPQLESFCQRPTLMPMAVGLEDGRIGRRVK